MLKTMFSGEPQKTVMRGVEVKVDGVAFYTEAPAGWPQAAGGGLRPQICWGGLAQPLDRSNLHFVIAGVPGTGKTVAIRSLMRSVFRPELRPHLGGTDRGVVYDPKQEFYPVLRGFGCRDEQIIILNPFDARGQAWNLAADYTTQADAVQLARTIIPTPESHAQPFFPKSAAGLLAAALRVYMKKNPLKWELADVLLACMSHENLNSLLGMERHDPLVKFALNFMSETATRNNIMAELASHVLDFLPVAGCWQRAKREGKPMVSVKKFLQSPDTVLLLGANQTHKVALSAINRLFLKKLSEETLDHVADGQWAASNRTWLVLDEVRELGKVEGLADLINKGRSRGVCAVLGFQDYPELEEVFGEKVAHAITATCGHKLYLRLGGESAEWASRAIGKAEIRETQFSRNSSSSINVNASQTDGSNWGQGHSSSLLGPGTSSSNVGGSNSHTRGMGMNFSSGITSSTTIRETDAILPSEIAHLPSFADGGGLKGVVCGTSMDGGPAQAHKIFVPAELLLANFSEDEKNHPGYMPRPPEHQELME